VDDITYRRARIAAAARDSSVSALVRDFLNSLDAGDSEAERLRREERALRDRIDQFSAADRLPRDEAHARGA
jgi:hypothetical protein